MRVTSEETLGETQLFLDAGSHGAGDNAAIELELLLHSGPERGGDLLGIGRGSCAACVVFVAVVGHSCVCWAGLLRRLGGGGGGEGGEFLGGCCGGFVCKLHGRYAIPATTGRCVGKSLSHGQLMSMISRTWAL